MTRQIKFAALLTIMTLALGGLARAQWDDDDDYYQRGNGAQARQSGYQNGYRDGVKQGRHEGRENDPEDFRAPAAGLARVGSAEILRIVLSPFVPALLDAIAIAILISGLPRLGAITALIVVVVIIPLRACQSAERKCHDGQKRCEFDLSRHYLGHLRSAADLPLLGGMREKLRFDAREIISFVRA